jgi:hypothetical protein
LPPLIQVATMTIDEDKRAILTAVGGTQFTINDNGMFPVVVSPQGRRLQQVGNNLLEVGLGLAGDAIVDATVKDDGVKDGPKPNIKDTLDTSANNMVKVGGDAVTGVVSTGNAVASSAKSTGKKIKKFFGR